MTRRPRPTAPSAPSAEDAFGPLYVKYQGLLRRRLRRFASAEVAEELTNEAFAVAMSRRSQFRGESMVSWLYQIATRLGLHHVRDSRRRSVLLEAHGPPSWAVGVHESPVEARVFLNQVWASLDEELMEIGVYHYLDGMPHHEIARIMDCSRRTVGNRLAMLTSLVRDAARSETPDEA